MDRRETLSCLELDDEYAANQQIESLLPDRVSLVGDWDANLPNKGNFAAGQLEGESLFVEFLVVPQALAPGALREQPR